MLPVPKLSPHPIVAPSLVVTNRLLGCNTLELPQRVLVEAAGNLILRLLPAPRCPRCGFPMGQDHVCALCARRASEPPDGWEERLAVPEGFRDQVLSQARLALDQADYALAEFIVASLDERGLLSGDVVSTLPQRAEHVLRVIQSLDPPGIAARTTAECLCLQLGRLTVPAPPAVYTLIGRWPDLPTDHQALARALRITPDELDEALAFMRAHLRPFPIVDAPDVLPYRRVDVAILPARDSRGTFEVIVAPGPRVRACDDPAELGDAELSPDDWRALAQHAELLNGALHRRDQMVRQVFEQVADRQNAFLQNGLRHHRPLTRAQVAQALAVHPSTVGRAAAGKSVLIPSGQIVPAALFFERGAAIKCVIRDIVAQEPRPLTDAQLQERLAGQGIVIARRTVAKYRAAAGVLPARLQWNKQA